MSGPPPNAAYNALHINVKRTQPQAADTFTYLDSSLSRSLKIDEQVARRISKVIQAFGRLKNNVWNRHGLLFKTNLEPIIQPIIFSPDELPIQQAEVDAAVDPKVQKPKEEEQVAAVEETGEVAAKATITSEQATEEVEQSQE
nr:unnamed protein product [Spirometra erinaceieuropaei]